jgi:uncharacterized repeat protein (TIGR01451 family)
MRCKSQVILQGMAVLLQTRRHGLRAFSLLCRAWLFAALLAPSGAAHVVRAAAESAIVPGDIAVRSTFVNIGVLWPVTGDVDRDSRMTLEFRQQGDTDWSPAAPAMRANPGTIVDGQPLGLNHWAASAMFLQPGTPYDLRATLSDPDGGTVTRLLSAMTRSEPQPNPNGSQRYVVPGNGGGDGSAGAPFRGASAAVAAAQPGDVFVLAAGTYAAFTVTKSGLPGTPIVFRGPIAGGAIIDGAATTRGVVTLADGVSWVILDQLSIQNGAYGVHAQSVQNVVLRRSTIRDVDFGYYNTREDNLEANQTLIDNQIVGRVPWPGTGIPLQRGIDLRGSGNIVAYNFVQNFGDCISVQPIYGPGGDNDIYGNDARFCVDDGIEIDYSIANTRVWRNRVTNARTGVSTQPIRGGPAYILRNMLFNLESSPIKLNNSPSGIFVFHNSSVMLGNGLSDPGVTWRNVQLRNNAIVGTRYAFEFVTVRDEGFRDFDYNAWHTTHTTNTPADPDFKWENVRYARLTNLRAIGVETHGIEAALSHFVNATLPTAATEALPPESRNLSLVTGAPEIDAGQVLPNINDSFVFDGKPDIGAFEYALPLPAYGPGSALGALPDLSTSSKSASRPTAASGDLVTYTLKIRNSGRAFTGTVFLTDTLPTGVSLLVAPVASSGLISVERPDTLHWSGALPVTITYAVTISVAPGARIEAVNLAVVSVPDLVPVTLRASVYLNGRAIYLPVALR